MAILQGKYFGRSPKFGGRARKPLCDSVILNHSSRQKTKSIDVLNLLLNDINKFLPASSKQLLRSPFLSTMN